MAALILIDMYFSFVMYWKAHKAATEIIGVIVVGLIALIVPFCGWQGAQNRNVGMLRSYSMCNYMCGFCDVLSAILLVVLCIVLASMSAIAQKCNIEAHSPDCDAQAREDMYKFCSEIDDSFQAAVANSTSVHTNINTTEISVLFEEEKCLDTLSMFGTVLLLVVGFMTALRCIFIGLHCASGWYGSKLRDMVQDEHSEMSESDSD
eukprot:CAMPEP_0170265634 /NCGR_PEP_ID=MMETSP0116_2-20130129/32724_1 /TAXON_ID=400756 /ORGANISM="Durinskia baltica, Strain CSIRO CS-38" /LENGTH=205 /DNA_ID=CAMNT_0010516751 /DNA_START=137 /DNA_END=754 /DNA_ORIENTATION=-